MRSSADLLHRCGRLFHQYIVDQYAKVVNQRLEYFRFHQKEIRAELYQGITDAIADGETDARAVGKRIVLPATFVGGPRQMNKLYQDAMGIVRSLGKPDLFITMTCNPKWPEITRELLPGQSAADRPDLITRVFNLRLKELLRDLTKKLIFGKVLGKVFF